ncbi:ferredoxin-NADPH reductase [Microbacterium sp. gxy059]|uniref:ferredoxin-NADPH reductase n=1 Tax=Microbacterium sp. gxy059 TaxID=2957199 RepID=UPI003D96D44D
MKRISHGTYAMVFSVASLVLIGNALLAIWCLPLVALLVTTDPSLSWPLIAIAAVWCGPGVAALFRVFRAQREGETGVVRPFLRGLRETWRSALAVAGVAVAIAVVAIVDVVVLLPTAAAIAAPLMAVVALLALAGGMVGLVAVAEAPEIRLRDVLRMAPLVAVRRWPFTVASLAVAAVQAVVFVQAPALGLGLTATACLYVVWSGGRHSLQPAPERAAKAAA